MIGVLWIRGVYALDGRTDLQTFSLSLILALAFVLGFEAIYKFLFFGWVLKPDELRTLLLQSATALTVLVGFAYGDFSFTQWSKIFLALFLLTMLFWFLCGYPQLFEMPQDHSYFVFGMEFKSYPRLIPLSLTYEQIYVVNRLAKGLLCASCFFLVTRGRDESVTRGVDE